MAVEVVDNDYHGTGYQEGLHEDSHHGDSHHGDSHDEDAWKAAALFGAFFVISAAFTAIISHLDKTFQRPSMKVFKHAFHKLQEELMLLGGISFLLVVFEEVMVEHCIVGGAESPEGCHPVWSQHLVHQTHVFVFVISTSHVLYTGLSLALGIFALRKWKELESDIKAATDSGGPALDPDLPPHPLSLPRALVGQFHGRVEPSVYCKVRQLFLQRTHMLPDFNFAVFIELTMVEDFVSVMGLDWFMFMLTAVVIVVPNAWSLQYWLPALFLMATFLVGGKLELVAREMAQYSAECCKAAVMGRSNMPSRLSSERSRVSAAFPSERQSQDSGKAGSASVVSDKPEAAAGPTIEMLDAADLFWLGRPRLVLKFFQYVIFENSLSIAVQMFAVWQEPHYLNTPTPLQICILLLMDIIIVLHSSLYLLPTYSLTASVGSHCAEFIKKYVAKNAVNPIHAVQTFKDLSVHHEHSVQRRRASAIGSHGGFGQLVFAASSTQLNHMETHPEVEERMNSFNSDAQNSPFADHTAVEIVDDEKDSEEKEPTREDEVEVELAQETVSPKKGEEKESGKQLKGVLNRKVSTIGEMFQFPKGRKNRSSGQNDQNTNDSGSEYSDHQTSMDMLMRGMYQQQMRDALAKQKRMQFKSNALFEPSAEDVDQSNPLKGLRQRSLSQTDLKKLHDEGAGGSPGEFSGARDAGEEQHAVSMAADQGRNLQLHLKMLQSLERSRSKPQPENKTALKRSSLDSKKQGSEPASSSSSDIGEQLDQFPLSPPVHAPSIRAQAQEKRTSIMDLFGEALPSGNGVKPDEEKDDK